MFTRRNNDVVYNVTIILIKIVVRASAFFEFEVHRTSPRNYVLGLSMILNPGSAREK